MTPAEAEVLAARTLAAIDAAPGVVLDPERIAADRERVASDLALHQMAVARRKSPSWQVARRIAKENLRRTAALYGVTP